MDKSNNHYYKDVSKLKTMDIYRVLSLYEVTDPCIQHAVKKLLCCGQRNGNKSIEQDVNEAIESLLRFNEMRLENETKWTNTGDSWPEIAKSLPS